MNPYDYVKVLNVNPDLSQLDDQHVCIYCPLCGKIQIKTSDEMNLYSEFEKRIKCLIFACYGCFDNSNEEDLDPNIFIHTHEDSVDWWTCEVLCYDKYMNLICTGENTYVF